MPEPASARWADLKLAVAAGPVIIACLTTYGATRSALEPVADGPRGRTLITLNSGTPAGPRSFADCAAGEGAAFLDGAGQERDRGGRDARHAALLQR